MNEPQFGDIATTRFRYQASIMYLGRKSDFSAWLLVLADNDPTPKPMSWEAGQIIDIPIKLLPHLTWLPRE